MKVEVNFTLTVKRKDGISWEEPYNRQFLTNNSDLEIKVKEYVTETLSNFNKSLRPFELPRKFIKVVINGIKPVCTKCNEAVYMEEYDADEEECFKCLMNES
jgi:hypothetical protein